MGAKAVVVACAISLTLSGTSPAMAEEHVQRVPLHPAILAGTRAPIVEAKLRETEIPMDRYDHDVKIVRQRTEGKTYATFMAEPQLIEKGAVALFEIFSVSDLGSVSRWRCIAVRDVAECLGAPVRIKYLADDESVVLTAKMKPDHEFFSTDGGLASR